jgi:hypothetical protein
MNDGRRYLTYAPWMGQLNNTRMCFETALVLAYISGRILVFPSEYRRRGQPEWQGNEFKPLHPGDFLDLDDLQTIVATISHDEYVEDTDRCPADVIDIAVDPGMAVFCHPEIPPPDSAEAQRLQDFAAGRQTFLELTPDLQSCQTLNISSPTLEQFYAFYYFSDDGHAFACKRLIRDHVKFRPSIFAAAIRIATYLGRYSALHVRRGDFQSQFPEQDISPQQILQSIECTGVAAGPLYVASDEIDKTFFEPISQHYETFFIEDFAGIVGDSATAEDIACIEQVVCAFAEIFLGTRLSTFSAYITRLRGYYNLADQAIHFTDGAAGSEIDGDGSPPFAWTNWIRNGSPLWGREYREGWSF